MYDAISKVAELEEKVYVDLKVDFYLQYFLYCFLCVSNFSLFFFL